MTVLYILGVLGVVFTLFMVVTWINEVSIKYYSYEFFNIGNLSVVSISYWMIFFGQKWYMDAIKEHGDLLNGQILIGLGVVMLILLVITHIKKTSFAFGIVMSILQLIIYAPVAVVSLFILIMAIAWLSDTKPYYRV